MSHRKFSNLIAIFTSAPAHTHILALALALSFYFRVRVIFAFRISSINSERNELEFLIVCLCGEALCIVYSFIKMCV